MAELIRSAMEKNPSARILVLQNNVDLIQQTARILPGYVTTYCAGLGEKIQAHAGTTVASVASMVGAPELKDFNGILIDEVHALGDSDYSTYKKILSRFGNAKVVGFTATPFRSSGKIYGEGKFFSRVCFQRSLLDMIDEGYLVKPSLKHTAEQFETKGLKVRMGEYAMDDLAKLAADTVKVKKQIAEAIPRLADRRSRIWACVNIEHCELVAREIPASKVVHSNLSREERDETMRAFRAGEVRDLVFVSVIKEGIDIPRIDAVVFMRPTRSPTLYVQVAGRGLRPAENKKDCLLLDFGGVVANLGPLDNPRVREPGETKAQAEREKPQFKFCPKCLEYIPIQSVKCSACGEGFIDERLKNLTVKAATGGGLLSNDPVRNKVTAVQIELHMSQAGNECLRVTYQCGIIRLHEYFSYQHDFAIKNWVKRAHELGVPYRDNLDDQARQTVTRVPREIETVLDGKYTKVRKLFFEGN